MLKSSRQHFYANIPLTSKILSCVSCFLVIPEILVRIFKRLTADQIYSCHNWQKLPQQVQTQLSTISSTFFQILLHFQNVHKILAILKKNSPSELQYVRSNSFWKMWLLECPETPVSERLFEINVLSGRKHCCSVHESTFMLMFH